MRIVSGHNLGAADQGRLCSFCCHNDLKRVNAVALFAAFVISSYANCIQILTVSLF